MNETDINNFEITRLKQPNTKSRNINHHMKTTYTLNLVKRTQYRRLFRLRSIRKLDINQTMFSL